MTRDEIWGAARQDLAAFFESRSSIRQYSDEPVDPDLIERAVRYAQRTPSVCNRQSGRVWAVTEPRLLKEVLEIQGGSAGFGDQLGTVLVVTAELSCFQSAGERNQGWIDGGMFAMALVLALHSLGLGTCCLNWSKERDDDLALRRCLQMGDSESIIMLIAVGNLPEELSIAVSQRRPIDQILRRR